MTLYELQNILGDTIKAVNDWNTDDIHRAKTLENADTTVKIAKQMVNIGDLFLRADKLKSTGYELDEKTREIIG